ncbi:TetR family transcriptional regulator [Streptomyces xiaopingdaonensis]|uniref:TetR family transcriptional regulator n=1 Tax=Streptomyces xiaopingdaonensis TaxID=1565415 RepID=UPI00030FC102|nr:TetR family transcriptional regulator [Streptomyces xiaopingdaonensis]
MTAHPIPRTTRLTPRQAARRSSILAATAELARSGGFDAVQMRTVAERSGVALGTVYRYFPSKIHLLVAVLGEQLEAMHRKLLRHPPDAEDAGERVAQTLTRAFRSLRREPQLADAMVRALTFADRSAGHEVAAASRLTTAVILDAMRLPGEPAPEQLSAVRVIEHTWLSLVITWLSGRASLDQVATDLATACRLVGERETGAVTPPTL